MTQAIKIKPNRIKRRFCLFICRSYQVIRKTGKARARIEVCETWGALATLIILIGILLEFDRHIGVRIPNELMVGGLAIEFFCIIRTISATREDQRESDRRLAQTKKSANDAIERAAKADLERVKLEAQLAPRMLNQEQWDLIQTFKGKFAAINIGFEADAEAWWFAGHLKNAFLSVGIRGGIFSRDPSIHSFSVMIFEPAGLEGSRPKTVSPLVELFKDHQVYGAAAIITGLPTDIKLWASDAPEAEASLRDTPMIIVGGRFIVPPAHWPKPLKKA